MPKRFGGYGLFVQHGKPVFVYNLLDFKKRSQGTVIDSPVRCSNAMNTDRVG